MGTNHRAFLDRTSGSERERWNSVREVGLCNHNLEEFLPVVGLVRLREARELGSRYRWASPSAQSSCCSFTANNQSNFMN